MQKYCTKCGITLTEKNLFCTNCGAAQQNENKQEVITDEEVKIVLNTLDDLLGYLPPTMIDHFKQTKEYSIYEKVMRRYKN